MTTRPTYHAAGPAAAAFWQAVEQHQERGLSRQAAIRAVVRQQPELHRRMLAEANGGRTTARPR